MHRSGVMVRTVIVPLKGSASAETAIPYGIDQARVHDATLVLVRIIARPELPPAFPRLGGPMPHVPICPADELTADEARARAYLDSVGRRFRLPAGSVTTVRVGDPYQQLVAEIQRRPAPLVVIAAGVGRSEHPAPGEMARRILRAGVAPILVVREGQVALARMRAGSEATHGTMASSRSPRLGSLSPSVGPW